MKSKRLFIYLPLLYAMMFSSMGCSGDDENNEVKSCVSGTIYGIGPEGPGEPGYVFIGEIKVPTNDEKYSYIEIVVVPKDEFPLQDYQEGDVIDFQILEVKSEFPPYRDHLHIDPYPYPEFLCSIKLCK
jgi:hypothetical protein